MRDLIGFASIILNWFILLKLLEFELTYVYGVHRSSFLAHASPVPCQCDSQTVKAVVALGLDSLGLGVLGFYC